MIEGSREKSIIFDAVVRILFFFLNAFALYLLLRGHNLPGGGFIAGVATALSLVLLAMALGLDSMRRVLFVDPAILASFGVALALFTAIGVMPFGNQFFEHFHFHLKQVPFIGDFHSGTTLIFDIGVYFAVIGSVAKIIFILAYSTGGRRAFVAGEEKLYSSPVEEPLEDCGREVEDEEGGKGDAA